MSYSESGSTRVRRFLSSTFGFKGSKNVTSWIVAGGIAYYFIYLPDQRRAKEILAAREAAKQAAIAKGIHDIDRARPIHPQDRGLIQGIKAVKQQQQQQEEQQQQQQHQEEQRRPPPSS